MKVFVTGASGVIGRRAVPLLCKQDCEVTAVVRSPAARAELERHGAATVRVDLLDAAAVRRAVVGHDAVLNLATHMPRSSTAMFLPWNWRENDRLRRDASALLVDACLAAGVRHFVRNRSPRRIPTAARAGSMSRPRSAPCATTARLRTRRPRAARFTSGGASGVVLRFGAFYGADAAQTSDLIRWVSAGWAPLPGRPTRISPRLRTTTATAAAAALTLPAGTYNVVDDEPMTHRDLADSLAHALGVAAPRLPPAWLTPAFGSLGELIARSVRISNTRLRAACDWAPKHRRARARLRGDRRPARARSSRGGAPRVNDC